MRQKNAEMTASRRSFGETWIGRLLMLLPAVLATVMWFAGKAVVISDGAEKEDPQGTLWRFLLIAVFVSSALMATLYGRFGPRGRKIRAALQCLGLLVVPAACFFMLERFTHDPLTMSASVRRLNILFFLFLELAVLCLSRRPAVASTVVVALTAVAGVANDLAVQARAIPVYPWDVASVGVALSVAGNYTFTLTLAAGAMLSVMALLVLLSVTGGVVFDFRRWWIRLAAVVASLGCLGGYVGYLQTDRLWSDFPLYPYLFTPKVVYDYNGFMVSFLSHLKYLKIEKPSGYSEEEINAFMEAYQKASEASLEDTAENKRPNVIVIMNEAFSDLSVLTGGQDYWVEHDPLSFYHSLTENTQRGTAYVSVKGGNTPNSEFEFLTGLSLQYLPLNSIPYQQYIKGEMPSLAAQLCELGYKSFGMHPYLASGWRRETVYPQFGFQQNFFLYDFYDTPRHYRPIRGFVSDQALVNMMNDTYEEHRQGNEETGAAPSDDPVFIFAVSMQNHGGYTGASSYLDAKDPIHAKGLENHDELTTYLSLLNETDKAYRSLIEYFSRIEEPTILCLFGDHQPNDSVVNRLAALYGTDISSTPAAQQLRYQVPVVIWANYDIEEKELGATSLNYLGAQLLEAAGLPLTAQQEFLLAMRDTYPAINGNGVLLSDGRFVVGSTLTDEPFYRQYAMLQYNDLFDTKHRLTRYFSYATPAR